VTVRTEDTNQPYDEITSGEYLDCMKKYVMGIGPQEGHAGAADQGQPAGHAVGPRRRKGSRVGEEGGRADAEWKTARIYARWGGFFPKLPEIRRRDGKLLESVFL
jgi:hypothetical protein